MYSVSSKKNEKNEVENVGIKAGIGEKPEVNKFKYVKMW
jgi:hypothetical protein